MNIYDKYMNGALLSLVVILEECSAYSELVETRTKRCYLVIFVLRDTNPWLLTRQT